MTERIQGVVKFFDLEKGYGFVRRAKGQADVFVHINALKKSGLNELNKGDKVEFELVSVEDGKGRAKAANLTLVA
jgi:cold shock protein